MSLTAAQIEAQQPINGWEQREERRAVHQVPVDVEPGTRQFRPRRSVRVPQLPGIGPLHSAMLARPHGEGPKGTDVAALRAFEIALPTGCARTRRLAPSVQRRRPSRGPPVWRRPTLVAACDQAAGASRARSRLIVPEGAAVVP